MTFTSPDDVPVEVIVDGTSLGVLPSGAVTLPEGPHVVQAVAYGPGGAKAVATTRGEGAGVVPPGVSGSGTVIPWRAKPGEDPVIRFVSVPVPLSYRLDRPEEVDRSTGTSTMNMG